MPSYRKSTRKPATRSPAPKPATRSPAPKPATRSPAPKPAAKPAAKKPATTQSPKKANTTPSSSNAPRHAPPPAEIKSSAPTPEPVTPSIPEAVLQPVVPLLQPEPVQPSPPPPPAQIKLPSEITSLSDTSVSMPEPNLSPPAPKIAASPPVASRNIPAAELAPAAMINISPAISATSVSDINVLELVGGDSNKASAIVNSSFLAADLPKIKNPNVKVFTTVLNPDLKSAPDLDSVAFEEAKTKNIEVIVPVPPPLPPTTALPVPLFKNINIKNTEIEVFYSIEDQYEIEDTPDGQEPKFLWLNDMFLKKSAYVDVILSMQVGSVVEDLTRRMYLDTSVKSFASLREEALSRKRRNKLNVMYKVCFEPFLFWNTMPESSENMLQLLEKTESTNMSVTIRTGLDRGAFSEVKGAPFEGDVAATQDTKDIIVNSKIKNFSRTTADTEPVIDKIITDEIIFDRILHQLRNSRIFVRPDTVKTVNYDSIYDKKRSFNSFFSPLFLSEDLDDTVRGIFFFDSKKFLEQYKLGEPQQGVINTSYVCNVKVTRNRVLITDSNSDFSNTKMFRKFDDSIAPVVVLNKMFEPGIYSDTAEGDISSVPGKACSFIDTDIAKRKSGKYKYEVEISIKDDSAKYFVRKLKTLRAQLKAFEKYITFTEAFGNTVDPTTGLFTEQFQKAAQFWWSNTGGGAQEPWRSAPIEVARTLQDDSPVLDSDMGQYVIPLLRVCHPMTGNDRGQGLIKLALENVIKFYEDRLAPYGKNMGSSFQGQTDQTSPSSGNGDYEKVTKFSYTFREHIDRDTRKNLRAKYFDNDVLLKSEGLLTIEAKDYKRATDNNRLVVLGEDKELPSEVSFNGRAAINGVNSPTNDTSMTFLSPANFCMGKEKYLFEDFLEPADKERDEETADKRAQIYEDTTFADSVLSTEKFLNKYGVNIIPLSSPETAIRTKQLSGRGQDSSTRSQEEAADTSEDAEISRKTMNGMIGGLVDSENSQILLDNPIREVRITKGKSGQLAITNFAGDTKNITEQEFNALPIHIKSVLVYLSKTSDPFTLNEDSYIKLMADNFESDVNDSYDARFFYELFFKQIQKVQFLSGFQKNKDRDPEFQTPVFKDLTKDNLTKVLDGNLLCRIVPYENSLLSYDANQGINGEPIEKHFILRYRESTFASRGNVTTIANPRQRTDFFTTNEASTPGQQAPPLLDPSPRIKYPGGKR